MTGLVGAVRAGARLRYVHAGLLAAAFAIFALPVAMAPSVAVGAAAAFAGAVVAEALVARRLRLFVVLALAALVWSFVPLVGMWITQTSLVVGLFGATGALQIDDGVRWTALAFALALALRSTAMRFRAVLAIEGGVVVLAVATTVSAHREGMIARPLEVADWFWSQGVDPVFAFLGIGIVGALLFAAILARGRSLARTLVELSIVLLLALVAALRIQSSDPSDRRDVIGGASEKKDDEERPGSGSGTGGQGGQGQKKDDDLPRPEDGKQNRPAAVVVFHREVTPAGGIFYFRHAAFSQYNGVRLVEATRTDVDEDSRHGFPVARTEVPPPPAEAELFREEVAQDVALLSQHNRTFALIDPVELSPMANPDPARFRRAYRVVSSVLTAPYEALLGRAPGDPEWPEDVWAHYTELPKDERYHRLAAELRSKLLAEFQGDPLAEALTVKRYLEENATYSFARRYEGEDPTAAFLFSEDKKGYCVHLAHSAAYLLRAMGVPTRVSAGYAVPAANLGGGSALLVKSNDAHAWAEIYLEGVGWVPIEVTPEKTDIQPSPFGEQDLQQMLGEMARKEGRFERNAAPRTNVLALLKRLLGGVPYALAALIAAAYLAKLWRWWLAPLLAGRAEQPRVVYRAALDRLSAAGVVRRTGESRERFAARVAEVSPSFVRLTATHVAVALGSRRARAGAADLRPLAAGVGDEARRSQPWWRWLLGVVDPVAWMRSR